jgi:DNA-binding CsgD family transcriptional regulator
VSSIEYLNTERTVSALVAKLQEASGITSQELAKLLGIKTKSFLTKMYRNSFSYDQILKIVDKCGFKIMIHHK